MVTLLKTLPDNFQSKSFCLASLMDMLATFPILQLVKDLSFIGNALHKTSHGGKDREPDLIEKFASFHMKADLLEDRRQKKLSILFHRCALKLLDELLRINPIPTALTSKISPSIEHLFLYANTLISMLEAEGPSTSMARYSESAKLFYSRWNIDRVSPLGRARMYKFRNFTQRLHDIGIEIDEYLPAIFSLCAHIENHPFIELEFPQSLQSLPLRSRKLIQDNLEILSSPIQNNFFSMNELEQKLPELYFTDALCQQKPLIQISNRYYCLQAKLLWTALSELPFHLLLNNCNQDIKKVRSLTSDWGYAFEDNFGVLAERAFPKGCRISNLCTKNHPRFKLQKDHHHLGDILLAPRKDSRILIEFKSVQPNQKIKLGDRDAALSKFIQLDPKGVPQLVRDAEIYREDASYNGTIYIVLICWGPVPNTKDFDEDLELYLKNLESYQTYLKNPKNRPLIYLDASSAAVLFGALRQGLPIRTMFKRLAGISPTGVVSLINNAIQKYQFTDPIKTLYQEEINEFWQTGVDLLSGQ
ncbi:MAG: hypothetical protein KF898_01705 [Parachlamydiales bacterium]|nr:hypothetical protein [Candidatus Acheromyda pituitae]